MRHGGFGLLNPYELLQNVGLQSGQVVMDLGCGALGHFAFPAAELVGPTGRVYAVDVQPSAIHFIERRVREHQAWHIRPVWSDVEQVRRAQLPFNTADLTLIVNVFYLARARERWAQAAAQITKHGGYLLVIDWRPEAAPLGPAAQLRVQPEHIQELCATQGWILERDLQAGDHHYGCLFRREYQEIPTTIEYVSQPLCPHS